MSTPRLAASSDDGPVVMLNLLRFREVAGYPDGEPQVSGLEAYQRYGELVQPFLAGVGGRLEWQGLAHESLIGPDGERSFFMTLRTQI